jgi:hypothetical protein
LSCYANYIALLGALLLTLTLASISLIYSKKRIVNWVRFFKYKSPINENVIDEKVVERHP